MPKTDFSAVFYFITSTYSLFGKMFLPETKMRRSNFRASESNAKLV
jgi:hypothetical protein